MSIEINSEILDKAARALDEADNRWQHGIGNSGESWERFVARAVLEAVTDDDRLADVWDRGYRSGFSIAMRRMSDEPKAPTPSNPYLGESDD